MQQDAILARPRPASRPGPLLSVRDLRAYYQMHFFGVTREIRAVDEISLEISRNEIYGLAGESSSGKSSLIKTIARAIRPPLNVVGGSVTFDFGQGPQDIYGLDARSLRAIRWRNLSYIMQGSMNVLNPVRRIRHAFIDFAFRHMGLPMPEFLRRVEAHLARLKLDPHVLDSYPHELSGGMRQRVTIALATVCRPEFIIADEPTTALDVVVQKDVLAMIRDIQQEMGSSILFVTHDMAVHANLTDRLGIMYAGRLVEEAPTRELFRHPLHPYTRHLIASLPRIGDDKPKTGLAGTPPNLANPPSGCRFHPRCPLAMEICRRESPPLEMVAPGHRVACHAVMQGIVS
ncbi:ABC transporter ATP-binding protein [Roseomonas marmotae]|uniref:ABC transporter ATP-binding protein n=1 Tax=Roseomonas marmotae TaxID=2768161 RepID=A0ABS3KB24_9PROT|nr:ABC transporter ATP-binding protein [Roseomonas marmotae]MBO1074669.1 ABC transporter ATP-binding protein [Roseomonas marmotae]QTI81688.1 ABC transporter ATP-binding protein [Roseomonas marmotae]